MSFSNAPTSPEATLLCNSTTYYVKLCLSVWLFEIHPQVHSPQPKVDNYKIKCPFPIHSQAQKPTLLCNSTTYYVKLCLSVWLFEIRPQVDSPQPKRDNCKIKSPFPIRPQAQKPTLLCSSTTYYVKLCLSVWLFEIGPQVHSPQPKVDNYKIKCPFPIHPQAQKPTLLCNSTTYYVKLCLSVWLFEIRPQVHSPQPKRDNCKIKCPFQIRPQAQKPTLLSNEKLCLSVWLFEIRPQFHSQQTKLDNYKIICPFPIRPQDQKPTLLWNSTTCYVKLCLSVWLFEIRPQVHSPQQSKI
jgi:hypothetical protein